jgi:hypothetical protein
MMMDVYAKRRGLRPYTRCGEGGGAGEKAAAIQE